MQVQIDGSGIIVCETLRNVENSHLCIANYINGILTLTDSKRIQTIDHILTHIESILISTITIEKNLIAELVNIELKANKQFYVQYFYIWLGLRRLLSDDVVIRLELIDQVLAEMSTIHQRDLNILSYSQQIIE